MFNPDSKLMIFLGKLADIVILNLLVIICSIPVFTIGAVWTSLYYVTIKMAKNEESYIFQEFFKSFKQNFKQATLIWLMNLAVILVYIADVVIVTRSTPGTRWGILFILTMMVGIVLFSAMIYIYPVLSHFENNILNTVKNGFLLSIASLPYTVLFIAIIAFPFVSVFTNVGAYIMPVVILLGIAGPAYLCSVVGWVRIFKKISPTEEVHESFYEQDED